MENHQTNSNQQLFVSLKLEDYESCNDDLTPHVYGSVPLIGSWESSNALSMQQQGLNSTWQLSFFVPLNQESLDFKFVLKPRCSDSPCIVEEGDNRFLREDAARVAVFKNASGVVLGECRVFVEVEKVSMFDLAACWRAYHGNTQHSVPQNGSASSLKPDGEYYMDSASGAMENSALVFAASCTETPRSITHPGTFASSEASLYTSHSNKAVDVSVSRTSPKKEKEHIVPDHSQLSPHSSPGKSKSAKTVSPFQEQERSARAANSVSGTTCDKLEPETKNSMPAAAGAVEAAAVADQMLGPKEDRHLAIVLVGLPARGKTFTSAKLTRYLRWLGHETKHFNVGKYRRVKHGANLAADFFRADNPEGVEARNEVAAVAMEDMIAWFQDGGQVGIFDATNSTRVRRNMLMKMAEGKCKIIFLETICNDERIIERNIRLKIQSSPDYTDVEDFEAGVQDFKTRLVNYEKVYEPVEEGSYIKMIDMASGQGGQIQVNNISGYLPGRIVFFLVNTHLTPHPILLTRHGESQDNVRGRIGGDTALSEAGELYSKKLADFLQERLEAERTASIWTSTLQRTILSAEPIKGYPKIQWRALEEINAGVCDGMTYAEIKENMPEEYESRKRDKLRYRYPRGESYLDIIQRLEPVIIELERQRAPVVVISHQAVLRALYAYFADRPLKEIPHIEVPLHTITEIQMGVTGVEEKRYKLMD